MEEDDDPSLVCPVGHSRGRTLLETLLKVKEELEEHRQLRSPTPGGEVVTRNSPEPSSSSSVLHLHHRLNQMEDKIDLITEVLVTTIQQLKLSSDVYPAVDSKESASRRSSSHSKNSSDGDEDNLPFKLEEVISQMTQEFVELSQEKKTIQEELKHSKLTQEETNALKEQLITLKTQMVRKEQQLLQIKSFRDALTQKESRASLMGSKKVHVVHSNPQNNHRY